MYQHTVADGHLLLLLQKGLHGGVGWPNLYFGGLYYTYVNNTVLWINMIQVHHFVSFVSARLFYVFGFFYLKSFPNFFLYHGLELQHLPVHKFVNMSVKACFFWSSFFF